MSNERIEQSTDSPDDNLESNETSEGTSPTSDEASSEVFAVRRNQLDTMLQNHHQAKLKRKLLSDSQIKGIAQEELKLKQRMVDQIDQMDNSIKRQCLSLHLA